ncbi:hypothetical protein NSQ26_01375 [Bacillus sp. FSL W7-1360]
MWEGLGYYILFGWSLALVAMLLKDCLNGNGKLFYLVLVIRGYRKVDEQGAI